MMEKMIFGRYLPLQSVVHQLDPRAKLLFIFGFVIVVFLANNVLSYGVLTVFTLMLVYLSKINIRFLLAGLKPVIWIVAFTFLLHIFLTKEGDLLFQAGFLKVYEGGVRQGLSFLCAFSY